MVSERKRVDRGRGTQGVRRRRGEEREQRLQYLLGLRFSQQYEYKLPQYAKLDVFKGNFCLVLVLLLVVVVYFFVYFVCFVCFVFVV